MPQAETVTEQIKKLYNEMPYSAYGMDCFPIIKSLGVPRENLPQWGKGKKILEVGCGAGHITNFLAGYADQALGVDISEASLALARQKSQELNVKNVDFIKADIFDSSFLNEHREQFDYILCYGVLHHTQNPYIGFKNLLYMLKPGGQVTIGLYSRTEIWYRIKRKFILMLSGNDWEKRERHANNLYFRGKGDRLRLFDSYVNPIVSFHSINQVYLWQNENNVSYAGSWPPFELSFYIKKIVQKIFGTNNGLVKKIKGKKDFTRLGFLLVELFWVLSGKSVMVSVSFKKKA